MENLEIARPDPRFWAGRRVLLTGHTGFKGAWLALWLEKLGSEVFGFALAPETTPNLFGLLQPFGRHLSTIGDIRDRASVEKVVEASDPEVVIHMAAQPLVRRSYREPVETFATNVMGTAHLLKALRGAPRLEVALVITTDKVYLNPENGEAFRESDPLGGGDPYSSSKAATEMVVYSWAHSFYRNGRTAVASARAGNVIGGGDWSEDRLIPDLWRAAQIGKAVELRYPDATRPWQHVLDPLCGYLLYVEALAKSGGIPKALNFGPLASEVLTVGEIAEVVSSSLGGQKWVQAPGQYPPEARYLALDASLARETLKWRPRLFVADALHWTADWYNAFDRGADIRAFSLEQLGAYERTPATPIVKS